ncbi:solute carrier family 25 (mitochondrial aspartate/glutamate transporter), member 12/13 [Fistulifera solaris]|uniref:Solute carrier family 25 (Mitochondrial aspartate/glutamate transporter), member 12/13 n=1 Tax=Fistulifera solaris TaxID=1519565 RepID=A0A1Z5K825_FISSO|nr:solute carrier family 25 (mitochondrial aspartate/glutamate transporter), member 12/13 [Fistulifera solaris]|eukprot:GAX22302.1 solute carrier family 25 (mitochondrial aspartate/glutamate transporter), member 12/13 [Fistulifera solaris]
MTDADNSHRKGVQLKPKTRKRTRYFPSHFKNQQDRELIRLAIQKSPFFACLDESQIERFISVAELKEFHPGDIVILEGCVDDDDLQDRADSRIRKPQRTSTKIFSEIDPADVEEEEIYAKSFERNNAPVEESRTEDVTGNRIANNDESESPNVNERRSFDDSLSNVFGGMDSSWKNPFLRAREAATTFLSADFLEDPPASPRSGIKRSLYVVRDGKADVWYQPQNFRPASLGPGTLFGEGGFLFGRQHSASVVASTQAETGSNLQCWVVDFTAFWEYVLPSEVMSRRFEECATKSDEHGVLYMTMEEFVESRRKWNSTSTLNEDPMSSLRTVNTLHHLLRRRQKKDYDELPRVYLEDFCFYHMLMDRPDPEVDIAFLLMDQRQKGQIMLADLVSFVKPLFPDLDLSSQFFQRYFGKDGKQSIRQVHFSQFLVDLQREIGKQAFLRAVDTKKRGSVEDHLDPDEFIKVLTTACGWRLPQGVADRLDEIYRKVEKNIDSESAAEPPTNVSSSELSVDAGTITGVRYFAYGDFLAFQEILGNLSGICNLIDQAEQIKKGAISPDDFKVANRALGMGGRLSRRQVEIIFALFDRNHDGYISSHDAIEVCGMDFVRRLEALPGRDGKLTFASSAAHLDDRVSLENETEEGFRAKMEGFVQHFWLTAVASSMGALFLYPLDLAKTRMMNEAVPKRGQASYRSWMHCLRSVVQHESALGLYRGLTPQLIGIGPEKLIKIQVNDLIKQVLDPHRESHEANGVSTKPSLWVEVIAGACAGACQLLVTNPMEVTKIHMQLEGETNRFLEKRGIPSIEPASLRSIVRQMGLPGVYRGATACLLRDVPFSAIYFPTYSALRHLLDAEIDQPTNANIWLAGTVAGIPAAALTIPADVVKTRLQSTRPDGEVLYYYSGVRDCVTKMYQQEGWRSFFRGGTARVLRLAPQFGISLMAYEQLAQWVTRPKLSSSTV